MAASASALADRSHRALLELYALESRLARAERRVAELHARARELDRRQTSARRQLAVARHSYATAQRRLATRLQDLYVEGDVDALTILLGAESFTDAIDAVAGLDSVARHDRSIVAQVRRARASLRSALETLATRERELRSVLAQAEATRLSLVQARAERAAYLAELERERRLTQNQIARLSAQAEAIETRSEEVDAAAVPVSAPSVPVGEPVATAVGRRQMTVVATGYSLPGTTATGMPVGWGVVAVDPSVIPLGTRMTIPGYGEGVAADTGSAVKGAIIDLWFPTTAQALQWGRRTVTITLHG